ncbi:hypothetical protein E0H44_32195, partial [Rhizobium leguminosarum bv. viciae]
ETQRAEPCAIQNSALKSNQPLNRPTYWGQFTTAGFLLHDSLNRNRFKDNIMQPFKVLQRPLRV